MTLLSRRTCSLVALVATAALSRVAGAAPRAHGRIAVVGAPGSTLARDVATELSSAGAVTELQASAPDAPPSLDALKACIAEGHQLAFGMDFAAAVKALGDCSERFGAVLARPEAVALSSSLRTELAAAAVGAGDRDRARAEFGRLARTPGGVAPDPSLEPPEVMAAWEEAKKSVEAAHAVALDISPPWATVFVDGQRAEPGEHLSLSPGTYAAFGDAAGFAPSSTSIVVAADTARVSLHLTALDPDARRASVRSAAGALPLAAPGVAEEIASAFGAPVVIVGDAKGPDATLIVPADAGHAPAQVAGHFRPTATPNPAHAIAVAVVNHLFPQGHDRGGAVGTGPGTGEPVGPPGIIIGGANSGHSTLYIVGGSVLGVLAVGATVYAVSNSQHESTGPKNGNVVWQP